MIKNYFELIIMILLIFLFESCSKFNVNNKNSSSEIKKSNNLNKNDKANNESDKIDNISFELIGPYLELKKNIRVKKWIQYFTKKDRKRFQLFLNRGEIYKDLVQSVLNEYGIPKDLFYLAMIESGYK